MDPRWRWDFEDERKDGDGGVAEAAPRPAPTGQASPPDLPPARPPSQREIQVRRRRAVAVGLGLLAVVLLAVILLSGSHHSHAATASNTRLAHLKRRPTPITPENGHDAAVNSVLAYTPFIREGGGRAREIALTFDDGPGPYTPAVLSVLERLHVHATFFAIGRMLEYFGASAVREIDDGDVVGDHTQSHPELARLSKRDQYEQLFEQIARVELLGGKRPRLFRPPYGSYDPTTMRLLHQLHLLMVLWSVDTDDYLQPGVPVIVARALEGAHPGAIILMHDGGGTRTQTIAALPQIITRLRAEHYRLVTVPQLLNDDPPPAGLPLPPNLSGD